MWLFFFTDFTTSENIRTIRQANLKQFIGDFTFYTIISTLIAGFLMADWDKELQKEAKESERLGDAAKATEAQLHVIDRPCVEDGLEVNEVFKLITGNEPGAHKDDDNHDDESCAYKDSDGECVRKYDGDNEELSPGQIRSQRESVHSRRYQRRRRAGFP